MAKHMTSFTMADHPEPAEPVRKYTTASGVATIERTTVSTKFVAGLTLSNPSTVQNIMMVN